MKVVVARSVRIPPQVIQLFRYLAKSQVSAIQDNQNRGLRVAVPFNGVWLRISLSKNKETKLMNISVEGLKNLQSAPMFQYEHSGQLSSAKELQTVMVRLVRKTIDELGTTVAEKIITRALTAIQKADVIEGEVK